MSMEYTMFAVPGGHSITSHMRVVHEKREDLGRGGNESTQNGNTGSFSLWYHWDCQVNIP